MFPIEMHQDRVQKTFGLSTAGSGGDDDVFTSCNPSDCLLLMRIDSPITVNRSKKPRVDGDTGDVWKQLPRALAPPKGRRNFHVRALREAPCFQRLIEGTSQFRITKVKCRSEVPPISFLNFL